MQDIGLRVVVLGTAQFERDIQRVGSAVSGLNRNLSSSGGALANIGASVSRVGQTFLQFGSALTFGVTLPLVALTTQLLTTGISFEEAFTGVGKTVDGVMDNFGNLTEAGKELERGVRDMALVMPIAATELAGVMQIAGQLGVRGTENLLKFTETAAMLGVATDFSAEQAATSFAKLANIVGVEAEDMGEFIDRAGSAMVELGNNFAATEPEIMTIALRIAGAGNAVGLTVPEILALSTAMVALGVNAEMGGSAVSRIFLEMQSAVNSGGSEFEAFAEIMGITTLQFESMFRSDPTGALLLFLGAIDDLNESGKLTDTILDSVNLKTIRTQDVLNRLGPNVDLITEATTAANEQWTKHTALMDEYNKFASTTASKIKILKNTMSELGITIFMLLSPAIDTVIESLQTAITTFTTFLNASDENQKMVLKLVGGLILLGPALTIVGLALKVVGGLLSVFAISSPAILGIIALGAAFVVVKENVFGLGDVFGQVTNSLSKLVNLTTMFFTQGSINQPLKDMFSDLFSGDIEGAIGHLTEAWDEFRWWFSTIFGPTLGTEWAKIKVQIMDSVREIGRWLVSDGIPMFLDFIGGVSKLLAELAISFLDFAYNTALTLLPALGGILGVLIGWLAGTAVTLALAFMQWVSEIDWGELLDTLKEYIGNFIIGLVAGFREAIGKERFDEILARIFAFLTETDFLAMGWDVITAIWEGMKVVFMSFGAWVEDEFGKLYDSLKNALGLSRNADATDVGKELLTRIWDGMKSIIMDVGSWVEDEFGKIYDNLKNALGLSRNATAVEVGKELIDRIWTGIKLVIMNFGNYVEEEFGKIYDKLKEKLGLSRNADATDVGRELINRIWNGINELIMTFGNYVEDEFGKVYSKIKEKLGLSQNADATDVGRELINRIWNGIKELWDGFKTFVDEKFDSIKTKLQEIVDDMFQLGKDLIQGIKNGVEEQWNIVKDFFSGIGNSIKDSIGDAIGWGSPATEFIKMGRDIIGGLTTGLQDAKSSLTDILSDIAKNMIMTAQIQTAPLSQAMMGAATGGSVTNNSNIASITNSRTFAPTINGAPIRNERDTGNELVRAWRMAQMAG